MARSVLVTLADERYLAPAKQLFACVHWNAGWSGDLLLLAHEVPAAALAPFRERGILVRECEPWQRGEPVEGEKHFHPVTVLDKFELFAPDFRRWENVLFLDADMMFWASLEPLARVRGFAAVPERKPLAGQYSRGEQDPERFAELAARFDLTGGAFNSGLLAFRTADVLRDDSRDALRGLYQRYAGVQAHRFGDQPALNLYFHRRWRRLPDFWAALRDRPEKHFGVSRDGLRVIGRHFAGRPRPWDAEHPLHAEWCANLARFDDLDARRPPPPREAWSAARVRGYDAWLHARRGIMLAREATTVASRGTRKRARNALARLRSR
jgi:lipopolysaccharide biosynthesis glycosyltransferase